MLPLVLSIVGFVGVFLIPMSDIVGQLSVILTSHLDNEGKTGTLSMCFKTCVLFRTPVLHLQIFDQICMHKGVIQNSQHKNNHILHLHVTSMETISSPPQTRLFFPTHRVHTGLRARTFVGQLLTILAVMPS